MPLPSVGWFIRGWRSEWRIGGRERYLGETIFAVLLEQDGLVMRPDTVA